MKSERQAIDRRTPFPLFAPLSSFDTLDTPLRDASNSLSITLYRSIYLSLVTNLQTLFPFYVSFFGGFPTLSPPICGSGVGDARSFSRLLLLLAAASSLACTLASSLSRAFCCSGRIQAT